MSNSIGLHQSLLYSPVLEHQGKLNSSGIPANSLFQAASINQVARKSSLSTKFYGAKLKAGKSKLVVGSRRSLIITPHAALAMDATSEVYFV